jgi:hypothetical protein
VHHPGQIIDSTSGAETALPASLAMHRVVARCQTAAFAMALAVILTLSWGCGGSGGAGRAIEVELETSTGHYAQLFWDTGSGFAEADSARASLTPGAGAFQRVRFPLPAGPFTGLRFDPIEASGAVQVKKLTLTSSSGNILADLDPGDLQPVDGIASMTRHGGILDIATTEAATDPRFAIPPDWVNLATTGGTLFTVTPISLAIVNAAALALLITSVVVIHRGIPAQTLPADDGATRHPARLGTMAIAGLFLVIVGAKLLLLSRYPSPIPFLDQWNAEAQVTYIPYHDGYLSWRQMASLHNEHRVFFTRLLALDTLLANGQWDPNLQQVVNAILHALTGVLTAAILWAAGARRRPALLLVVGLVFGLPFGWENTLAAFQSAFYFLVLFSVLALWLTDSEPGTVPWALGWLCAVASLFTSAGGVLTTLAIVVMATVKWMSEPARWRQWGGTVAVSAVVLGIGAVTSSPPLPHHALLGAASSQEFLQALGNNLAWPLAGSPGLVALMWLPVAALALMCARHPERSTPFDRISLGLAAWAMMQAMAIAYSRGGGGAQPASRYMDLFSIGFLINAVTAVVLADRVMPRWPWRLVVASTAIWLSVALVGLAQVTETQVRSGAEGRRQWMAEYVTSVRQFVATDNLAALRSRTFPLEVPYPNQALLANAWLRHDYIRRILPPSIREPLHLKPVSPLGSSYRPDGFYPTTPHPARAAIGTYTELGNGAQGDFTAESTRGCEPGTLLEFEVAGYLGRPGLSLGIHDAGTGRDWPIAPSELAGERWLPASVRCPGAQFAVTATDRNPDFWFAFDEPVEVPRGSHDAEYLIDHAEAVLLFGLTLLVLCLK